MAGITIVIDRPIASLAQIAYCAKTGINYSTGNCLAPLTRKAGQSQ
ncbi:hypothetical protein [Arthrobacter pigmenti]